MDINDIKGLGAVFTLIAFLGVVAWAYSNQRKERFERDGNIPFDDHEEEASHYRVPVNGDLTRPMSKRRERDD
jgi:cytochrome c oxidase cbb3-type subunit 4